MLTLSVLAAESQAVLRLGGSRVMVINNADKKEKEGKRVWGGGENCTMNMSNKYVGLDKKERGGMRYSCKRRVKKTPSK